MKHFRTAVIALAFWTAALGIAYPLFVTGLGAALFPRQAAGSRIDRDGKTVGSALIGQRFSSDAYFHGRPSAIGYDASSSGGSNQGWTSKALEDAVAQRGAEWTARSGASKAPDDMLFASGSGLDPHISPEAARMQAARVAAARGLGAEGRGRLEALVERLVEPPQLGFLGEPRVNVLELNLAVDEAFPR